MNIDAGRAESNSLKSPKSLLSVTEAALIAGVSRRVVLREIARGRLRAERVGRAYVVFADALDEWTSTSPLAGLSRGSGWTVAGRGDVVARVLAAVTASIDVDEVPRQLVSVLLRAFGADRAWLLYPCDPTTSVVSVPYEVTVPEYPGALAEGAGLAESDLSYLIERAMAENAPIAVDIADESLPIAFRELHQHYQVKSLLAVAFRPRGDRSWLIGLHQCARPRVWTLEDRSILAEIAGYAAVAIEHARLYDKMQATLRSRDEFLSSAAHELKTPVAVLRGYSQVLLREAGPSDDARVRRALEAINRSTGRISRLTHDLLEVASLDLRGVELHRSRFDLGELARSAVADAQLVAGDRRIQVTCDGPAFVLADQDRIADVLFGLIDNALKYSPRDEPVDLSLARLGDEVIVSVRDRGRGIPLERQASLFEPFYEPHPTGGAGYVGFVGLGLYLARRIVERHHGRIWLESAEGQGTTFHVALPADES